MHIKRHSILAIRRLQIAGGLLIIDKDQLYYHSLLLPVLTKILSGISSRKSHVSIINERSEFFRGLSDKSEYERPGPARPGPWPRF